MVQNNSDWRSIYLSIFVTRLNPFSLLSFSLSKKAKITIKPKSNQKALSLVRESFLVK
jgi:hypothetical protein